MSGAKAKTLGGKILRAILWIITIILAAFVIFLIVMSVTEYKPAALEKAELSNTKEAAPTKTISAGDSFTIMSWNIGYGALGDNADFFMDGGQMVRTADKARVLGEGGQECLLYIDLNGMKYYNHRNGRISRFSKRSTRIATAASISTSRCCCPMHQPLPAWVRRRRCSARTTRRSWCLWAGRSTAPSTAVS